MGARYALTWTDTLTTGYLTAGILRTATGSPRRFGVYDFMLSNEGTPADNVINWRIRRHTASATNSTAFVPNPLDPAEAAFTGYTGDNQSAEPTYTANSELFELSTNVRATYRWVAAPGSELKVPATASNGIGIEAKSPANTNNITGTVYFEE